jgi:hydrogenase maturation protease
MAEQRIAVLGLGNILMQDEGVGVHIANLLQRNYEFDPSVEIVDGGTLGTDLLPYLERNDRLLIIDAVNFGKAPGYVGMIQKEDILTRLHRKVSLHHLGLTDLLSAAKILDIEPAEICLIGIQPHSTETGLALSAKVAQATTRVLQTVISKLKEWHISCVLADSVSTDGQVL